MGRGRLHFRAIDEALLKVARGKGIDKFPRSCLGRAAYKRAHLVLGNRVVSPMRERNLRDLAVEMHRVLAHELDQGICSPFGERRPVRDGHRPDGVGQLLLLQWDAFDDSALPHCGDSLVQARVLRELLRLKRKHRLIARGIEVGYKLLRIGLLQLVGIAYVDQSLLACEGHGVASRYDIGPQCRLAVEGVGVEREITVLREALAEPPQHGRALERVLPHNQVGGNEWFLLSCLCHAAILSQGSNADAIV